MGRIRTRPIGDVFVMHGKKYKVVECDSAGCQMCDMYDGAPDDPCSADIEVCGLCYKGMRKDDKQVYFKELKDHEQE